jgi:endoglucanase
VTTTPPGHTSTTLVRIAGGLLALVLLALGAPSVASSTGASPRSDPYPAPATDNPLAAHTWGVYHGNADMSWRPYLGSAATQQALLDKIVQQPKSQWFGKWIANSAIAGKIHAYIANATGGDPDVMVQMAIFRMDPWEHNACSALPTLAQKQSYRQWIRNAAAAIGGTYVSLVLQPDGPFALCAPGGSKVYSHLLRYAAKRFATNPNTSVYIDAGAADWNRGDPARAVKILRPAGIQYVRGFALGSTHYDATSDEIAYGTAVVQALDDAGIFDKHFVVNTAANGRPFAGYSYDGPDFDNARVCTTTMTRPCTTLGIPPTSDVANVAWGLAPDVAADAAAYCDGYVWVGRPWLYRQASPFVMRRALALAASTPY